jgi:hypothetical protein
LHAAVKSPEVKAVARHWAEVKGSRQMPGWGDIQPSRITRQLPIIWAYSYDRATDTFTGRLAGDRIEAMFGKTFRHTPLADIFPPGEYQDVFERAKRVIDEPAVYRCEGLVFRQLNRFGYGERIILPLASDGVHADGILGCTEYQSVEGACDTSRPLSGEWFSL